MKRTTTSFCTKHVTGYSESEMKNSISRFIVRFNHEVSDQPSTDFDVGIISTFVDFLLLAQKNQTSISTNIADPTPTNVHWRMLIKLRTLVSWPFRRSTISSLSSIPSSTQRMGNSLWTLKFCVIAEKNRGRELFCSQSFSSFFESSAKLTNIWILLKNHVELKLFAASQRRSSVGLNIHVNVVLLNVWRQAVDQLSVSRVRIEEMWIGRD